jgi:hypothetical protein
MAEQRGEPDDVVFPSRRGGPLSSDGVAAIVTRHTRFAAGQCPSLPAKTVTPHVLRHTCAMRQFRRRCYLYSLSAVHDGLERRLSLRGHPSWTGYLALSSTRGGGVRVEPVVMPHDSAESWTLVDEGSSVVAPAELFLAHLAAVERSPNTVRAYAHDLRDYFAFLVLRGLDWSSVRLEDLGAFVTWLRLPPAARDGRVVALPSATPYCSAATINRKLSASRRAARLPRKPMIMPTSDARGPCPTGAQGPESA